MKGKWKTAEEYLAQDPTFERLIMVYGPCQIIESEKKYYFEELSESIVGQQLSGKAAATIFARLKNLNDDKLLTPEFISSLDTDKFRSVGISRQKSKYLLDLADKVLNLSINLEETEKMDDEAVIRHLIAVKGIGRWTAEMFLMFSLARPDVFPVGDLGIKNAVTKLQKIEINEENLRKIGDKWKPYRTIASWYLWKSLEDV